MAFKETMVALNLCQQICLAKFDYCQPKMSKQSLKKQDTFRVSASIVCPVYLFSLSLAKF